MTKYACIADWDQTLRRGYTLGNWLLFLSNSQQIEPSYVVQFEKLLNKYRESQISHDQLADEAICLYSDAIKHLDRKILRQYAGDFVKIDRENLMPFTKNLAENLKDNGIDLYIVTGAPKIVMDRYKEEIIIREVFSVDEEEFYDINSVKNHGRSIYKEKAKDIITSYNSKIKCSFGDSLSDLPILKSAEHKFFFGDKEMAKKHEFIHVTSETVMECVKRFLS